MKKVELATRATLMVMQKFMEMGHEIVLVDALPEQPVEKVVISHASEILLYKPKDFPPVIDEHYYLQRQHTNSKRKRNPNRWR